MRLPNGRIPLLAAATVALLATAATIPALGATAKLGGSCTKSQVGKTSGTLVCVKSGTKYKWARRTTSSSTTKTTSAATSTGTGTTSNQIDVAAIAFGAVPTGAASKLDVACSGLSGSQSQAVATVNFGAQGGTNRMPFALVAPSSTNPTGSVCTASASAPGAVRIGFLINGLPDGTTSTGPTATSRSFTGADAVVTILIEYTAGSAPAAVTTTTAPLAGSITTTTLAGATTTTTTIARAATTTTAPVGTATPPPASGRPELATRFLTAIPAGMTGIDFTVNCTPPTSPGAFQTQTVRLGVVPATAQLTLTLTPGSATVAATACQVEGRLLGSDVGGASLRFLLNGLPMAGGTTGNFINSPTFTAPQAYTITLEVSFPSLAAPTTTAASTATTIAGATTTPTLLGATTTTITPGAANQAIVSLNLSRTGTAPANLDGYFVDLACNNVLVGGNPNGAFSFRSRILATGGTSSVPVTINPASTCTVTVTSIASTGSIAAGNISVTAGGVPRASGAGGAASTSPFPILAGAQTVAIAISY